jgi:hypothetical protein
MIQAILTGDLVGSSRAKADRIAHTMSLLSGNLPAGIGWSWTASDLRFTRFRGDGWQMRVPAPDALRWAVTLLASLRADPLALRSRISIGVGAVASLGTENLSDGSGPAFEASGRGLDAMDRDERLFLMGGETAADDPRPHVLDAEKAVAMLMDERISRWTPQQAEATAHFLHPDAPTATQIAQQLGITPQAVSYRLRGAGAKTLRSALETLEARWAMEWATS